MPDEVTVTVPEGKYLIVNYCGGNRAISPEELRELAETDGPVSVG